MRGAGAEEVFRRRAAFWIRPAARSVWIRLRRRSSHGSIEVSAAGLVFGCFSGVGGARASRRSGERTCGNSSRACRKAAIR